ncbi:DUF1493 family protein [Cedecea neteri]|uniref:DUF1493 domain-containing protein n=1 Tax=Cedecea neteri TaxID=158822 RepID=A0AAN0S4P7_9ENTR|nr:DUF1493 family protein [Cedecea neteri]AIR61366.1 hypothetical protein LH23_12095 [Cedecea neteri]NIG74482.1 DUF1493 family protein [Klebsiella sp. Ap-873]WNJ78256.1 DUF1493 family protein [Cedecea neteri]
MHNSDDVEQQVLNWYQEKWNVRVFPFFRKQRISLDTSLSTGKYPWSCEDAEEILEDYFTHFNVNKEGFSFIKHWPNEEVFLPLNFLRSKEKKWKWIEPEPLTLRMLVESAKAGYWIYN